MTALENRHNKAIVDCNVREVSQKLTYYPDEISIKPFTNC